VVLDDIDAPSGVRVTLLEGGQQLESSRQGRQLQIRIPDAISASLPARQAYVLKLAGAR
jgi:alpha-L-fucosidase